MLSKYTFILERHHLTSDRFFKDMIVFSKTHWLASSTFFFFLWNIWELRMLQILFGLFFFMFCLIWWWKLSSYSHVSKYTFYSTAKTKIGLWSYINILCLSINFNIKISLSLISFLLLCCQWVWLLLIYCSYSHEHYWSKKAYSRRNGLQ